ncbi:MAG: entericidin A/B family lipoprotein [Planctomycetota bacterium]
MKTIIRIAVVLAFATFALSMTGCNTVEGIGEDISAGGEGIADVSRDVQDG